MLERLECWEEALASYDRAIALDSRCLSYYNRASVLKVLKRLDEAVSSYDHAIALNEGYVEAYVNRGTSCRSWDGLRRRRELWKGSRLRPVLTGAMQAGPAGILGPEQKYLLGLRRHPDAICDWR